MNNYFQDQDGKFVEENGGRDISLFRTLANYLNFTFVALDPGTLGVERSRGSTWKANYTFGGILGQIHNRKDPFHVYLGDTTQTYTRYEMTDKMSGK